mgnify:CR=1 FL=1
MGNRPYISEELGLYVHNSGVNKNGCTIASYLCLSNGFTFAYKEEDITTIVNNESLTNIFKLYQPSLN